MRVTHTRGERSTFADAWWRAALAIVAVMAAVGSGCHGDAHGQEGVTDPSGAGSSGWAGETSRASCNCASAEAGTPCTAREIAVSVGADAARASFSWRFSSDGKPVYCGRFANGDYWVAPRQGHAVVLESVTANGRLTVDADPVAEATGLLDGSNAYGNHDRTENVLRSLPARFSTLTSLVAAKQRDESAYGPCGTKAIVGECVDAYDVVTVLPRVPEQAGRNMIRPNITGQTKDTLTLADFDFSRLPGLGESRHDAQPSALLRGGDPARLEQIRQRWSHSTEIFGIREATSDGFSEGGRAFRAHVLHHDYASGMAQAYIADLMVVFSSDNTLAEKTPALAAMIAFGLDIYHARYDAPAGTARTWSSGAGQWNGQFLPPVFAAALMRDSQYAQVLRRVSASVHADDPAKRGPSELRQINVGVDGRLLWGDRSKFPGRIEGAYWSDLLRSQCFDGAQGHCNGRGGSRTQRDPYGYIDGPPNLPGTAYMGITAGIHRGLGATMFLMPRICWTVSYPPLVRYVDRLDRMGRWVSNDPCAPPDPRENPATCDPYRGGEGCRYYRRTWGPDPDRPGQCISNGSGRFTSRTGPIPYLFTTEQVETNWSAIRGSSDYCSLPSTQAGLRVPDSGK